ncbi:MAG: Glucan 1,4-alpha-glucosidase [Hydrocarboniphaga sp.]|uniref:glycoside hydrolase family 15 protein n=1 Tax=Hydrocarboniphaga sp. TaxID=2033016 RepID=UPI002623E8A2|nr:glycoside hydrolase family 15 protein [Hydrocarboniphaga sp.]MDB5971251.1 Glucan 1,4-alpha-glucosidase [Hydrocarboniphaga sp.]
MDSSGKGLEQWIAREYRYAASAMQKSISAVDIVKTRPGFGQTIRPAKGSIIASPVLAAYDPDPDYFFHWYRDSAVVIDALRLLLEAGDVGPEALATFGDFVRFGLSLQQLDGGDRVAAKAWRAKAAPDFVKYLRDDADLAGARAEFVVAETRVNPDGTLDISKWARPQHDGPPLRALALLGWVRGHGFDASLEAELAQLIRADLAFTAAHWREPSFDIWEEERGLHYYTLRVSAAALERGAAWLATRCEADRANAYREQADAISRMLDGFWLADEGYYRSRISESGARSAKDLDIAVILSAIHSAGSGAAHGVHDPRMQATLARLDALFDEQYLINRQRPAGLGPAMGRYQGDVYYSGGAYFFSTLGAAEFCFRAAPGAADAAAWMARGDAYLATVRRYTPDSGELSEQFDQQTGAQTSARHLAWSYAAFISCIAARRDAVDGTR